MKRILGAIALALTAAIPAGASEYFDGKTVTYIVSTNPGGNYDAYARLVGRYLGDKLGADKVMIKNVNGAGHIIGTNTLYASKPDGYTIGTFNTGLIYAQILGREGVAFDLSKMEWIGKASSDPRVLVLSSNSGFDSFEALKATDKVTRFAASGIGSAAFTETKMLADGLDLPITLIPGYQGNAGEMAMLRGEVSGQLASLSSIQSFIDAGNGFVAIAVGGAEEPKAMDYAQTDKAKSIISLIDAMSTLGRMTAAPPGTDPAVVEELRDAYMAVMEDPDFLAEAKKLGLPIEPTRGDEVATLVQAALKQSPETVAIISSALDVEIPTVSVSSEIISLENKNKVVGFNSDEGGATGEVSGSRTKVMVNGSEAGRGDLAVGMACEFEYNPDTSPVEFAAVNCKG
ncbi:tripartite tricarboxylate transporter substrate binding protein [Puniceibacterium sp. IMCC21224]|uniref:Bug family tripartite tricarboxylate transporter substrate binding protein n=1 Tax=Puniceibacterium sp. IMCC21224 TaxID=1618204 RepID=UPI00064D78C3|nr:tripartite tricarboxylate transporter substrate-binding protein [Puniceibacterium sp. IMCC21224]KMK65007.1 hypothetical protein IMCC21224_12252 [Puniceibacterium sp. IMCC21224]